MKFMYKLFFSITALLTAAFMLFGSFMLFSYFNRMLERETEQGKRENLLFQTIYDMVYQQCRNCGYIYVGTEAPETCPACLHPQAYFEVKKNNY